MAVEPTSRNNSREERAGGCFNPLFALNLIEPLKGGREGEGQTGV